MKKMRLHGKEGVILTFPPPTFVSIVGNSFEDK